MSRKMKKIEVMHNHAYQTISELFGFMHQVPQTRHRNVTTKRKPMAFLNHRTSNSADDNDTDFMLQMFPYNTKVIQTQNVCVCESIHTGTLNKSDCLAVKSGYRITLNLIPVHRI